MRITKMCDDRNEKECAELQKTSINVSPTKRKDVVTLFSFY